jgi:hypothetical protein
VLIELEPDIVRLNPSSDGRANDAPIPPANRIAALPDDGTFRKPRTAPTTTSDRDGIGDDEVVGVVAKVVAVVAIGAVGVAGADAGKGVVWAERLSGAARNRAEKQATDSAWAGRFIQLTVRISRFTPAQNTGPPKGS